MVNATSKTSSKLSQILNLEQEELEMPLSTIMNTNMGQYALLGSKKNCQTTVMRHVKNVAGLGLLATTNSNPIKLPADACQNKELLQAIPIVLIYVRIKLQVNVKAVVIAVTGATLQMTL